MEQENSGNRAPRDRAGETGGRVADKDTKQLRLPKALAGLKTVAEKYAETVREMLG